jgi:hypothetical protein
VRVVALEEQVVDRNVVKDLEGELFVDQTGVHVLGEQLTRRERATLAGLPDLGIGIQPSVVEDLIGSFEEVGDPARSALGQDHLQLGESLERPAHHPVDGCHHRVQTGENDWDGDRRVIGRGDQPGRTPDVRAQRNSGLGCQGQQRVPVLGVYGRQSEDSEVF